ncbi:MAG: hypothetical protein AB1420_02310 [Bacillota bacterium]
MSTIFTFVAGVVGTVIIIWLYNYSQNHGKIKWYKWFGVITWYLWTIYGISFVYLNIVYHETRAATIGAFMFFVISIIGAILLARTIGILKTAGQKSDMPVSKEG